MTKYWVQTENLDYTKPVQPDPRLLFEPSECAKLYNESLIETYFLPSFTTFIGFAAGAGINAYNKRPVMSGIQKYFLFMPLGYAVGELLMRQYRKQAARKDAILRDYISQHPEDFPVPEPIKLKYILSPWVPIR